MDKIGSTVIYMGTQKINQVQGTQPVWGVKNISAEDEKTPDSTKTEKKSFAELLNEELENQKQFF